MGVSIEFEPGVFDMSEAVAPLWNIARAELYADRIVVTFRDGFKRTISRAEVLGGLPQSVADELGNDAFARGRFDPEVGTVVWPNGADISPEYLRWGPHLEENCPCGH